MKLFIKIALTMTLAITLLACNGADDQPDPTPDPTDTFEPDPTDTLDPDPTETVDPDPTDAYDPRSLVPERCDYLDNIDDWQPVWCDEFDEDGLPSPDRWAYDVGGHGWGNNELQYYTRANLNNAFIEDGVLHIQAIKESFQGNEYTSARLVTKYYGDWEYARIQVMARMPSGRGLWPAIWMLPTEWRYGGWPYSGEIDIMEYVGYDPGIIHGTIHTGAFNHSLGTQIGYSKAVPTAETEFHLYEMVWEPRRIRLYIDGEQFAIFGYNPDFRPHVSNTDAWPFDQPFHLILNVAVGGDWGGAQGVDDSIFPQSMEVKYVRVYQKDYAGMTDEPPSQVSGMTMMWNTHDQIRLKWNHAEHDVMVSHYNIYVDDVYHGRTTLNAYTADGLDPGGEYVITVEAVDFAGQAGPPRSILLTTDAVQTVTERIQAQDFISMRGVQVVTTDDTEGEQHITSISDGDEMSYVLQVVTPGTYRVHYRVRSDSGGEIALRSVSPRALAVTTVPDNTDGWVTITSEPFTIARAGVYTYRLVANVGGFEINYFEFERLEEDNGHD